MNQLDLRNCSAIEIRRFLKFIPQLRKRLKKSGHVLVLKKKIPGQLYNQQEMGYNSDECSDPGPNQIRTKA